MVPPLTVPLMARGSVESIAMLGDSLTRGGKSWKVLGHPNVQNFGINGARTGQILKQADAVIASRPDLVFVMAGINDINQGIKLQKIFNNYKTLLLKFKEAGIRTVVQSTLYTASERRERKVKIRRLNLLLKKFAEENGFNFLDLVPYLCENQKLKPEYDHDGLHINYEGYLVWAEQINRQILKKID